MVSLSSIILNFLFVLKVCPTFGPAIIKRVLNNFVPDEFSPGPIPQSILIALDFEVSACNEELILS